MERTQKIYQHVRYGGMKNSKYVFLSTQFGVGGYEETLHHSVIFKINCHLCSVKAVES